MANLKAQTSSDSHQAERGMCEPNVRGCGVCVYG